MLDILKSLRRAVTPIAFNVYDVAEEESLLPRLALVFDNTSLQEDPVTLEWVGQFFEMREWIDEKTTQRVFQGAFTIPISAYEVTVQMDRKKLRRPGAIAAQIPLAESMAQAFSSGKLKLVMDTFRQNPLAYDGQNLFDTDHTHTGDKESITYSNVLTPDWATVASPTTDEVKAVLHDAFGRFITNRAINAEVIDTSKVTRDLVVIVHNVGHWAQFNKVLTMTSIDNKENELKGSFSLFQDLRPKAGQENYFEVIYGAPKAPRPVIFVVDEEPKEVKVDTSSEFKNRLVDMGMEGYYGTKPGWPQVALQVRPT